VKRVHTGAALRTEARRIEVARMDIATGLPGLLSEMCRLSARTCLTYYKNGSVL
jgi:hypothetical protein